MMEPIARLEFSAAELMAVHPPELHDANKRTVHEIAMGSGAPIEGELVYAQWSEASLPESLPGARGFTVVDGFFDYTPVDGDAFEWHVNFADPSLFVAYGTSLMAQDELQCAEHPALGSLREALDALESVTLDAGYLRTARWDGSATPVTVAGVQRRCAIDTTPDAAAGRPEGLYGNEFARASSEQITAATTPLNPATISNILAIAAPSYGHGAYTREQIGRIARTAFAGFSGAASESRRMAPGARTIVHTGFWGCGAFGGNRTVMTVLQALAAELAEVDVVFHAASGVGPHNARDACALWAKIRAAASDTAGVLDAIAAGGFEWGVSDGT